MKKLILSLPLVLCLVACTPSATPPALAPGYTSQADEVLGQTLAAAHSFYTTIQNDINAGTYKPAPAEVTGLNNFGQALNIAQTAYLAYHSNPTSTTLATAQSAVNNVSSQQATLTAQITAVK